MPIYYYSAIESGTNKALEGKLEAQNLRHAKELIREQGYIPTELNEETDVQSLQHVLNNLPLIKYLTNPSLKDIAVFTQQLYTLLDAGIPLIEGLYLLEQQTVNQVLRDTLHNIRTEVIAGDSFSASIARYPHVFSRLYVNMIRAGEVSGNLDEICFRLAALLEKEMVMRGKVTGALVMPAVTVLVIVLVVVGLLVFVVPQFAQMFSSAGNSLPLPTQILVMTSDFLVAFWWALLIAVGALGFWFNYFRQSDAGKPLIDQWTLSIPVFGDLLNKSFASSFVRTLATLTASGVSLTEGIGTASGTIDNYVVRVMLDKARDSILVGGSMSRPLEQSNVFPYMVTKMIAIGEETGNLEGMLYKASDFLDREVDEALNKLIELIQPVMTVVLGVILTFILIALYLPIFDMHKNVG